METWDKPDLPRFNWWHVYPTQEHRAHVIDNSGPCWCNPWLEVLYSDYGEAVGMNVRHRRASYWPRDRWMPEFARLWHGAN